MSNDNKMDRIGNIEKINKISKKYYRKMAYFIFAIIFGVFMFIYGGYDDSPGGQLLGLTVVIINVLGLIKNNKNKNL